MEKKISYRIPEGFNPYTCMDTIRGLVDAIHHFETEGPGTDRIPSRGDRAGLTALLDQLQLHTHELHDYFNEIQNSTTLELPLSDSDFESLHVKHARKDEVKEPPALYAIR